MIFPDGLRRCPAVDPDDYHLFVSLGCAAENLAPAALAYGSKPNAILDENTAVKGATNGTISGGMTGSVVCTLEPTRATNSPLFRAIAERQFTRADYDAKPLTGDELRLLERAGTGDGVNLRLITRRPAIESVLEYALAANTAQMNDPVFISELKSGIRLSTDEALRTGDGLFASTSGSPAVPRWLGSPLMRLFSTVKPENEKYARQIRNSAGIAVFVSNQKDKRHWIETGRCYERFALQAAALGIRNAFSNQPIEVTAVRTQFSQWLELRGATQRPDLLVRFGLRPTAPFSMRRPVQAVLV